jgi:hypothetical protein
MVDIGADTEAWGAGGATFPETGTAGVSPDQAKPAIKTGVIIISPNFATC